jgi:hypothetical protein
MVVNYKHFGAILGSIGSFFVFMIGLGTISRAGQTMDYSSFYLAIIDSIVGSIWH